MSKTKLKIFVISLKHRQDRRNFMQSQFDQIGIDFEFFDALSLSTIPSFLHEKVNDNFRRWFRSRPLGDGEKGCYASHYMLWCKCLCLNQPIIILEDDCYLESGFADFVLSPVTENKSYICIENHPHIADLDDVFCFMSVGKGARGYYIAPKAAAKFIEQSRTINRSVDNFIGDFYLHTIAGIGLQKPIVSDQTEGEFTTDIQSGNKSSVPVYMKATREMYRFYRFVMNKWYELSFLKKNAKRN